MDSQSPAAESQRSHHKSSPWTKTSSASAAARSRAASASQADPTPPGHLSPPTLDLLPLILPHHSNLYQAQLLQYNQLISPGRGGGAQPSPHFTTSSATYTQTQTATTQRFRSLSKVSNKDHPHSKSGAQNCHGNKSANSRKPSDSADRVLITPVAEEITNGKMSGKKQQADRSPKVGHSRPPPTGASRSGPPGSSEEVPLSSSVPSTPHQRPRKLDFAGSREPSPDHNHNHSPRSVYSDTNPSVPSLRPLRPPGCRFETAYQHSRRRMAYSIGTEKLEKVDLDKIKSRLGDDDERRLNTDMRELFARLLPTQEREKNRNKLVQKLERIFNEEWPGHSIKVHLFGSSGNMLCSDNSDVDICIKTDYKALLRVCLIAEALHRRGMENVVCINQAKVPIVKIWDPELNLACDMNVNNDTALENTRMVRTYVQIDERVRPLAMIIKHWTRRRIVNDAGVGGTLSSYTWICMIIAFLQLRKPPILPALHQRPERLKNNKGTESDFADDLEKLRDFGKNNKETLGGLLFQFFRFYAHEFDYDKYALSIRLGKLVPKTEKGWHHAVNNCLCVEEPWNTVRNLGNTADDTSFRGLHLELRRAFDLISEGKLDECCEQYEFPKEEERVWHKPAAPARPAILRSSSQSNSNNRGGRGGGGNGGWRGSGNGNGRQYRNGGGNSSRRASSVVAYDTSTASFPVLSSSGAQGQQQQQPQPQPQPQQQHQMTATEAQYLWYRAQQAQQAQGLHQDIFGAALNSLQAHETNLRFQLLAQHQQHYQQHYQPVQQTQQRMRETVNAQNAAHGIGSTKSTDRSRTNSFDNAPLTAPLLSDAHWLYPYAAQPQYFANAYMTYPPSPSASNSGGAGQDFRRSLQRSTVTSDSGVSTGTGSLRSQSQPASRSSIPTGLQALNGYAGGASPAPTSFPSSSLPTRQLNGITVPSSMHELALEQPDLADGSIRPMSETPPGDGSLYAEYYVSGASSPVRRAIQSISGLANGLPQIPPYGGVNPGRRRTSTEQTPQTILDRRMGRTSRSPSPAGHARALSVETSSAPLASTPFPQNGSSLGPARGPLIVNGTAAPPVVTATSVTSRQSSVQDAVVSEDASYSNPLHISQHPTVTLPWVGVAATQAISQSPSQSQSPQEPSPPQHDRPVIVNGSTPVTVVQPVAAPQSLLDAPSFKQRVAMSTLNINAAPYLAGPSNGAAGNGYQVVPPSSGRARASGRHQHNAIEPLDLATNDFPLGPDIAHLSPVYEHQAPAPSPSTFGRKFESHRTETGKIPPGNWRQLPAKDSTRAEAVSSTSTKPASHNKNSSQGGGASGKDASPRGNGTPREGGLGHGHGHGHTRGQKSDSEHAGGWQKQKSRKKAHSTDTNKNAGVEQMPKNDADRKGG